MNVLFAFVDVGQGDCTIAIDRETAEALVIDCPGGRSGEIGRVLADENIAELRVALITHSDWDHLGGVYQLTRKYFVRELRFNFDTLIATTSATDPRLRAALLAFGGLEDVGVDVRPAYAGDAGTAGQISWEVLAPSHGALARAQAIGDRNVSSAIVRLAAGELTALVAGDADGAAWRRLLDGGKPLDSLVMRIPHHGAAMPAGDGRAALDEVLDAVRAKYHVISVGTSNRYGHPALSTLEELRRRADRARLLCTEVNGICLGRAQLPQFGARRLPLVCQTATGFREGASPCAGTINFELDHDGLTVTPSATEQRVVTDALENPMSRQ